MRAPRQADRALSPAATEPVPVSSPDGVTIAGAARVVKPPEMVPGCFRGGVFLAGSIDMGKAVNWQDAITSKLAHLPTVIFNPRRDDWDASWVQDISNPQFREQVEWELDCLDACEVVAMYFDPAGPAPISLLELGLHAASGKLIVCCPEGYWRRGNVQIICARYRIPLVETVDELAALVTQAMSGRMTRDRNGLGPKGASAVPVRGCALSPSNPSSPTTTKRG